MRMKHIVQCCLAAAALACTTGSASAAFKLTCNTSGNTDFVTAIAIHNTGTSAVPAGKVASFKVKDVKGTTTFHAPFGIGKSRVVNLPNNLTVDANSKCTVKVLLSL